MVDDAPYRQELVQRHIDQVTGARCARKGRKQGKCRSPTGLRNAASDQATSRTPDTPQTHLILDR
jgi:hypothetical protein